MQGNTHTPTLSGASALNNCTAYFITSAPPHNMKVCACAIKQTFKEHALHHIPKSVSMRLRHPTDQDPRHM